MLGRPKAEHGSHCGCIAALTVGSRLPQEAGHEISAGLFLLSSQLTAGLPFTHPSRKETPEYLPWSLVLYDGC